MTEVQRTTMVTRKNDEEFLPENIAVVSGILMEEFSYSHTAVGRDYFKSRIKVKRLSGTDDIVPIVVASSMIPEKPNLGPVTYIEIRGRLSSYRRLGADGKNHLEIFVLAHKLHICEEESELKEEMNSNRIFLCGTIVKKGEVRETPFGRYIMDLMIKVPRPGLRKSYFFPCIAWGHTAMNLTDNELGDQIKFIARFQSRDYIKKYDPSKEDGVKLTTYELSIMKVKAE